MQWIRDGLKLIDDAGASEALAEQTGDDLSVYLVPAFTGLGAPYWDPDARGALLGMTRDTGINEVVTAGLMSVCYQTKDLVEAIAADGAQLSTLRVDGGMVKNNYVLQKLADVLDAEVHRPAITETTALGAAYMAGLTRASSTRWTQSRQNGNSNTLSPRKVMQTGAAASTQAGRTLSRAYAASAERHGIASDQTRTNQLERGAPSAGTKRFRTDRTGHRAGQNARCPHQRRAVRCALLQQQCADSTDGSPCLS